MPTLEPFSRCPGRTTVIRSGRFAVSLLSPMAGALVLLAVFLSPVLADPGRGHVASRPDEEFPQFRVNDDITGEENRRDPAMVALENGNVLVAWIDGSRGQRDILVREFTAALEPLGEPRRLNDDHAFAAQWDVYLGRPASGRVAAVWRDNRAGREEIYLQTLSTVDGAPLGTNIRIDDYNSDVERLSPEVATSSLGTSLVVWTDHRVVEHRVYCRLVNAQGQVEGPNRTVVPEHDDSFQANPTVAALPDGRWIVAWDERPDEADAGGTVYYRFLAADGSPLAPIMPISEQQAPQRDPAVLVQADGIFLVWSDDREREGELWGRWLTLEGAAETEPARIRTAAGTARDRDPRIVAGLDGSFAVTWFGSIENRERAFARWYQSDRSPAGPEFPLQDPNPGATVYMHSGDVAPGPPDSGSWIVAWSDDWTQAEQVFLDLADPATGPQGSRVQAWSMPGSASQIFGDVAYLPDGRAVVVYGDAQEGSFNILYRILRPDGQPDPSVPSQPVNVVPINRRLVDEEGFNDLLDYAPFVAASEVGTFVVVWTVDAGGGKQWVYGQLFDSDGQFLGSNFTVDEDQNRPFQSHPRVAMAADGRFAIVYASYTGVGGSGTGDVRLQLYDPSGAAAGAPISVADPDYGNASQILPSVAMSPFGEIVVAWADNRGCASCYDIFRVRFSTDGERQDEEDQMQNGEDGPNQDQLNPAIAFNGNQVVTIWEDRLQVEGYIRGRYEEFPSALGQDGQRARIVDFTVNPASPARGLKRPDVAMAPDGRFIVTWWDRAGGDLEAWAQRYKADGSADGLPYRLFDGEITSAAVFPTVEVRQDDIQYIWTDSRNSLGWDIYARRVDWNFGDTPLPVDLHYYEASVSADGVMLSWGVPLGQSGARFRVWRDYEDLGDSSPSDLAVLLTESWLAPSEDGICTFRDSDPPRSIALYYYLEAMDAAGETEFIGPVETTWSGPDAAVPVVTWAAAPNPFSSSVRFTRREAGGGSVDGENSGASTGSSIRISDVHGRLVREVRPFTAQGAVWDGRDARGRMVPAGMYYARFYQDGRAVSRALPVLRISRP